MESKLIQLNHIQLCSSCGRAIKRGMSAIVIPEENLFFCNSECLFRDFNGVEEDESEYN